MLALCKEIVIFLIVAKIFESLQSGEKYGKYVKLIIALIVVLKLITPVFSLFNTDFDFVDMVTEIEKRLIFKESDDRLENETEQVENIEIPGIDVKVEEIQWEK